MNGSAATFMVMGVVFLVLGISGPNGAFLAIGLAFLAISLAMWVRGRKRPG